MCPLDKIKSNFPIFKNHPELVYLDSAATTQTPEAVLAAMTDYYTKYRANTQRGLYALSETATTAYEQARADIATFIGAETNEVVFTGGATHGLNLLASQLGKKLTKNDSIVLTRLEHHANLIPWQQVAKRTGAELRFINITKQGEIDLQSAYEAIDETTKIVSVTGLSNALGTIAPLKEIIAIAKESEAITIVDASQLVGHSPTNVRELDCDFLVFSGHKVYGPTGIGVLYGKTERLDALEPWMFGGEMIEDVSYTTASWTEAPHKFEAGTQNIAGAIGLGAAVRFLSEIGLEHIQKHEAEITAYALEQLAAEAVIIGPPTAAARGSIVSFIVPGIHPHDLAELLGREHMAVRAGHHCAKPLMKYLDVPGTVRASFGMYSSQEDVDRLIAGIKKAKQVFRV